MPKAISPQANILISGRMIEIRKPTIIETKPNTAKTAVCI
jgi:hypothetical protein